MDSGCIKRRGRRGGKKRYPAFGNLPSGRAPVGSASVLSETKSLVASEVRNLKAQTDLHSGIVSSRQIPLQTSLAPKSQSKSICREMLGAQARAAELQAMRAAAQRQRSHESEDPPRPAPVSLTEFVRPLQNRNKGSKTYKPLNLADLDEDEQSKAAYAEDHVKVSVPMLQNGPGPAIMQTVSTESSEYVPELLISPMILAPIAPKAMLTKPLTPHLTLLPKNSATPKQQPQLPRPQNSSGTLRGTLPARTSMINPLANPYLQVPKTGPSTLFPNPLTAQFSNDEFLFGLNNYSPCKPEIRYDYSHELAAGSGGEDWDKSNPQHVRVPHGGTMAFNHQTYHDPYQLAFPQSQMPYGEAFVYHQSPMPQYLPGAGVAGHGGIGYFPDYNQMNRAHSFVNDLMNHENEIHQTSTLPSIGLQQTDQPYDRSTKMQSFVAAQQAMARTGKTVLHNPFLQKGMSPGEQPISSPINISNTYIHNSPTSTPTTRDSPYKSREKSPSEWAIRRDAKPPRWIMPVTQSDPTLRKQMDVVVGGVVSKKLSRRKVEEFPAIVRALERRDEPVVVHQTLGHDPQVSYKAFNWPTNGKSYTRLSFPADDNVNTDSWCELCAPTHAGREKTRRIFRTITADMNTRDDRDMMGNHMAVLGDDARRWLHAATDLRNERRKAIDNVVDDYMTDHAPQGTGFGIIGGPVKYGENSKVNIGSVKAFANVMATIDEYAEEGKLYEGRRTFVPIPDYAIDTEMVHDANTRSMFENEKFAQSCTMLDKIVEDPQLRGNDATHIKSSVSLKLW